MQAERLTAVVVLPTPPFWFAMVMILPKTHRHEFGKRRISTDRRGTEFRTEYKGVKHRETSDCLKRYLFCRFHAIK
jgi:hypothetical protein